MDKNVSLKGAFDNINENDPIKEKIEISKKRKQVTLYISYECKELIDEITKTVKLSGNLDYSKGNAVEEAILLLAKKKKTSKL